MEQNNGQEELIDLSRILDERESSGADQGWEDENFRTEIKMSGLYGMAAKFSGGLIRTEKQAKTVLIILIILLNAITFSLILGNNKTEQQVDMGKEGAAMQAAE